MNRKEKIVTSLLVVALVASFGIMAMQQGQLYELSLQEPFDVEGEATPVKGHLTVSVLREGETVWEVYWSEHNVITNEGKLYICDQIGGTYGTAADYIGVGTGTGGGVGDTDLQTQFSTRQQGTFAEPVAYNWTITTTFAAGFFAGETITEAACFDAATTGNMLNYQDFTGITLQAGDSLQVQFEFQVS